MGLNQALAKTGVAHLLKFAGEDGKVGGKSARMFVDEGTRQVETIEGGKKITLSVDVVVSQEEIPARPKLRVKVLPASGERLIINGVDQEPGLWRLDCATPHAR